MNRNEIETLKTRCDRVLEGRAAICDVTDFVRLIQQYEKSLELISKLAAQNNSLEERLKIAKIALMEIDERCSRDNTTAWSTASDAVEEILDIEQELQSNDSL